MPAAAPAPNPLVHLFYGENSYQITRERQRWEAGFRQKEGDLNLTILDGKVTDAALAASVEALPFLGTKRLTVVRDFDCKKEWPALTRLLTAWPESSVLLLTAEKPDGRTAIFKNLKKYANLREFAPLKPAEFRAWLATEARRAGVQLQPAAAELLTTFTLGDEAAAVNELAKLAAFAGTQTVSAADVARLVPRNLHATVFQLTDALGSRDARAALAVIADLTRRGENLVQLFFMLVRQIRIFLQLTAAGSQPPAVLASQLKLHPFVVQNSLRQLRNFAEDELRKAHTALLRLDTQLKTGGLRYTAEQPGELALALEKFVLSFGQNPKILKK